MRPTSLSVRRALLTAKGFTIIEVVVALTLLACGALAVTTATAAAVRAVASAETRIAAMYAARGRLEDLASRGCLEARGGASVDPSRDHRESWRVSSMRNGLRLAINTLDYADRDARKVLALHRLLVC
jgi:prepilin-type N-terminal cleavage/methylation domain-containing protein